MSDVLIKYTNTAMFRFYRFIGNTLLTTHIIGIF